MDDLKRQIKFLEREINAEKSLLLQETNVLINFMHTTKFLYPTMLGAFAVGCFIGYKPSLQLTGKKLSKLSTFFGSLIKNVQLVLPLIL